MKTVKQYILTGIVLLSLGSCDKDFVEINTDPYAVTSSDPALLFAGAQRTPLGNWSAEHTIVQHFVCPYNDGATLGFNFNADIDLNCSTNWNAAYPGPVRNLTQALRLLGDDTDRVNLRSMIRIWKAQTFMGLVDTYGDVPYFEAGKAVSDVIFFPEYDDDALIYDDLYKEIKESLAALSPSGDYVSADLFYGANAHPSTSTSTAADQVAKWKKLGNSLLLRLGMRYTKLNAAKAKSIVEEAFAGGVMTSNADNAFVKYDGATYVHEDNNGLRNFSHFNYAAEPFVDQLKSTNDPRAQYMIATYENAGQIANDPNPDTDLANQFGAPVGVTNNIISSDPAYRGVNPLGGLNYSQINIHSVAAPDAPSFYVTYAQTSLLLAEAAQRTWVSGTARSYYENAVLADMAVYSLYPSTAVISGGDAQAYLNNANVDFTLATNDAEAFDLINTQYWLVNFRNGVEAFANFRRSGLPALSPNLANSNLGGGFARRMSYPDVEGSTNNANYVASSTAIGGDNLTSRVFWDN